MAEAYVYMPKGFGDNADEIEKQLAFVESLTKMLRREILTLDKMLGGM